MSRRPLVDCIASKRHAVGKRKMKVHLPGITDMPFLVFKDHPERNYKTTWDLELERGNVCGDHSIDTASRWSIHAVLSLRYIAPLKVFMCVVDRGPYFNYYRYQWIPLSAIGDERRRNIVTTNIANLEAVRARPCREFWVSTDGENVIRDAFQ